MESSKGFFVAQLQNSWIFPQFEVGHIFTLPEGLIFRYQRGLFVYIYNMQCFYKYVYK